MINTYFHNNDFILFLSVVSFFISFLLISYSKIPFKTSAARIKKYVPKYNNYIIEYIVYYFIISIFGAILCVKIIFFLNGFSKANFEINLFSCYMSLCLSLICLFACIIVFINDRIKMKKNDDILFIMNNIPDFLFKKIYLSFNENYYKKNISKNFSLNIKRRKKMEVCMDKSYLEAAKSEVLDYYIKDFLVLIIILFIIMFASILFSLFKTKKISIFNFVFFIPIFFLAFFIIRNFILVNNTYMKYINNNGLKMSISFNDSAISIYNINDESHKVISRHDIKRIVYLEHAIIIITKDNHGHLIPNCGNIDYLLFDK